LKKKPQTNPLTTYMGSIVYYNTNQGIGFIGYTQNDDIIYIIFIIAEGYEMKLPPQPFQTCTFNIVHTVKGDQAINVYPI
jgi:cold shock CspA family protein